MSSKHVWAMLVAGGMCTASAQPPVPQLAQLAPQPAPQQLAPQQLPALPPADKLLYVENLPPLPAKGAKIDIIRSEGGVPGPVVEDKPYSARSITESTQTLADGNRITQRNEAAIYRDGKGRTRHEQTLTGVGPWQAGEPVTMINIHDPVAGKSYVLDPAERTAREIRPFEMAIGHAQEIISPTTTDVRAIYDRGVDAPAPGAGQPSVTVIREVDDGEEVALFTRAERGIVFSPFAAGAVGADEAAEDLGEQVLEGLLVQGTRMTDTIPAGTIGNERPIDIVTERWYSKDIDAIVLHRFSDPRFGETTYRLVNVVRGEPSEDLFEVPRGYEIKASEMPRPGVRVLPGSGGRAIELGRERRGSAD